MLRLHVTVWLFVFARGLAWAHAGWSPGLQRSVPWGAIRFDGGLSALFCVTFVKTPGRS